MTNYNTTIKECSFCGEEKPLVADHTVCAACFHDLSYAESHISGKCSGGCRLKQNESKELSEAKEILSDIHYGKVPEKDILLARETLRFIIDDFIEKEYGIHCS